MPRTTNSPPTSGLVEAKDFSDHFEWDLSLRGSQRLGDGEVVPTRAISDVAGCGDPEEGRSKPQAFHGLAHEAGAFGPAAECFSESGASRIVVYEDKNVRAAECLVPKNEAYKSVWRQFRLKYQL